MPMATRTRRRLDLLATPGGRRLLFAALYASEGAPIGFLWWALPARLRAAGLPVADVTLLTAVLALPWACKFLWAPLVDVARTRRWTLRSWIVTAQLAMGILLLPLLYLDPRRDFRSMVALLLVHAIVAATQDVAVDTLAVTTVPAGERGAINGWMQAGMLAGRSLLGGGALVVAASVGDRTVVLLLIAVVWSSLLLVLATREPAAPAAPLSVRASATLARLRDALGRRRTWLGLLFAAIAGAGFEAVGGVVGPYLVDRGVATGAVGLFFSLVSVPCMVAGALLGGLAADRVGRRRTVAAFLVGLAAAIVLLAVADAARAGTAVRLLLLGVVYFAVGLFTASSYALFMDLTDPHIAATQFTAFMALTNACESWSVFAVGKLIPAYGYPAAFTIMSACSLLGLPVLRRMAPHGRPAAARGFDDGRAPSPAGRVAERRVDSDEA
jgi:Major Facilitator Superfamily